MEKIGIIGYGNLGAAIAQGLKDKYVVGVYDKDQNKITALKNITAANNSGELVKQSEVIILAVKPQDFGILLNEIKPFVENKLLISIAAGITSGYIKNILGKIRIVRCMPNIAVKILEGETSICSDGDAQESDLVFVRKIFNLLGKTWEIKEEMLDAVTAISGSGPAYILYAMEINKLDPLNIPREFERAWIHSLKEAALEVGIDWEMASDLAASTTASTIHFVKQTGNLPLELRKMITSAGGTTEAALKVITNGGSWSEAAVAAKQRARELSIKACLPAARSRQTRS